MHVVVVGALLLLQPQLGWNRKEAAASVAAVVVVVLVGYVQREKDGGLELCGHCSQTHQCNTLLRGVLHQSPGP